MYVLIAKHIPQHSVAKKKKKEKKNFSLLQYFMLPTTFASPALKKSKPSINDDIRDCSSHWEHNSWWLNLQNNFTSKLICPTSRCIYTRKMGESTTAGHLHSSCLHPKVSFKNYNWASLMVWIIVCACVSHVRRNLLFNDSGKWRHLAVSQSRQ